MGGLDNPLETMGLDQSKILVSVIELRLNIDYVAVQKTSICKLALKNTVFS